MKKKLTAILVAPLLLLLVTVTVMTTALPTALAAGDEVPLTFGPTVSGTLNTTTGVLTVSGTGNMMNCAVESSPLYAYKDIITTATITDGVNNIGSYLFYGCTSLTSVTIPSSVSIIGTFVFYDCTSLTSITIPEGVTSIGSQSFLNCSSLTSITLPSSLSEIGADWFNFCTKLTRIDVAADNPAYVSEAGVVYNKTKITLVRCPTGITGSFSIPNGVTNIGYMAFYSCSSLSSVTIPASVTLISSSAFQSCSGLRSITIPNSVTTIAQYAFKDCSQLTAITNLYNGNQAVGLGSRGNLYPETVFSGAGSNASGVRIAWAFSANTNFVSAVSGYGYIIANSPVTTTDNITSIPLNGTIDATLISVTHPASMEYTIEPGLGYAAGAFIAPDIAVTNNTIVPVRVTVKSLASAGGVGDFTDAAPGSHDWENLNTTDSKTYIALGLQIPTGSAGWNAGYEDAAKYAVDISDTPMGVLAASATGHITMLAHYGLAFDQPLTAHHNMVLMFDLV